MWTAKIFFVLLLSLGSISGFAQELTHMNHVADSAEGPGGDGDLEVA